MSKEKTTTLCSLIAVQKSPPELIDKTSIWKVLFTDLSNNKKPTFILTCHLACYENYLYIDLETMIKIVPINCMRKFCMPRDNDRDAASTLLQDNKHIYKLH